MVVELGGNNMREEELRDFIGKTVSVFVRYGFKKKVEETQNYKGKLLSIGERGIIIERKLSDDGSMVHDFFPWHNIDAIRYGFGW